MKALRITGGIATSMGLLSLSTGTFADGPEAIATAARHAGLAAAAEDIAGARRHLHHTLNCLVGPEGEGFDESAGNPCADAGGAIPQTDDGETIGRLEAVATNLRDALENGDLTAVKEAAMSAQGALQ